MSEFQKGHDAPHSTSGVDWRPAERRAGTVGKQPAASNDEPSNQLDWGPGGTAWGRSFGPLLAGFLLAGCFYGVVFTLDSPVLNRYFLGHPVAIAASTLFCNALTILGVKALAVRAQRRQAKLIRDTDVLPDWHQADSKSATPSQRWAQQHDAGYVARSWLEWLGQLPGPLRSNLVVLRLAELLSRQSSRGTTKHLGDDLRELSERGSESAHDSLGLVRIIIWAIPMLGFLGTVIGITQTLGGLDFSDGTEAVDRLKSGLYVAFDTTALGLVLSVVAIFIQFPVERSEQAWLDEVDHRVRDLVSSVLPADDPADDQTVLIMQLCDGIRAAVGESLATQTALWRQTIEEAQDAWQARHREGNEEFRQAISDALRPALADHAAQVSATADQLEGVVQSVGQSLNKQSARFADHSERWLDSMGGTGEEMRTHRRTLLAHTEALTEMTRVHQDDQAGMGTAVRTLARALDLLTHRLPTVTDTDQRRAA